MNEIALNISEIDKKHILEMEKILTKDFDKIKGVFTKLEFKGQNYFLIAFDKNYEIEIKARIFKTLCYVIREQFKANYIKNNLILKAQTNANYNILVKALCCFDRESDEKLIKEQFRINNNFSYYGFYKFKLANLTNRWKELIGVSNQNNTFFTYNETFYEILKFVISSLSYQSDSVEIKMKNDKYVIYCSGEEVMKADKNNWFDIVTQTIGLNPKKIILQNAEKDIMEYLIILFEGRVEII